MIVEKIGEDQERLVFRKYEERGWNSNVYYFFPLILFVLLVFIVFMTLLYIIGGPVFSEDFRRFGGALISILIGIICVIAIPTIPSFIFSIKKGMSKVIFVDGANLVIKVQELSLSKKVKTKMEFPFETIQAVNIYRQISLHFFWIIYIKTSLVPGGFYCLFDFRAIPKILPAQQQEKINSIFKPFTDDFKSSVQKYDKNIQFKEQYLNTSITVLRKRVKENESIISRRFIFLVIFFFLGITIGFFYFYYTGANLISILLMITFFLIIFVVLSCYIAVHADTLSKARKAFQIGHVMEATGGYKYYLEHHPTNAIAWSELASISSSTNDLDGAIDAWENVARLDSTSYEDAINLAVAWGNKGDSERAIPAFKRALTMNVRDPQGWYMYRQFRGENADSEGMSDAHKHIINMLPADADAKFRFGLYLALDQDFKKSRDILEQAVQLAPKHEFLKYLLSMVLDELGYIDAATQQLRDILFMNPKSFLAWYLMGLFLIKRNDLEGAKEAKQRYLSLTRENVSSVIVQFESIITSIFLFLQKGLINEAGDFCSLLSSIVLDEEKAKRLQFPVAMVNRARGNFQPVNDFFENFIAANQTNFAMIEDYVQFLVLQGQVKKAFSLLDEKLARYPKSDGLYQIAGQFFMSQHRVDTAISNCLEAVRLDPDNWRARLELGTCYLFKENLDEAIKVCSGILVDNADYMPAKIMLNLARKRTSKDDSHEPSINIASSNDYNGLEIGQFEVLIFLLDFLEEQDQALAAAKVFSELHPYSELAWIDLGIQLSHFEKWDDAVEAYKKSIEINPYSIKGSLELCFVLSRKRMIDDAANIIIPFLEKFPLIIHGWIRLARMYLSIPTPDLHRARNALEHARFMNPQDEALAYENAVYYALSGEKEKALELLQEAIDMNKRYKKDARNDELFEILADDERFQQMTT